MDVLSNQVRLLVEDEIKRGSEQLDVRNTRLAAQALALQRKQLDSKSYAAEVELWQAVLRSNMRVLHLKAAAAAYGGQLPDVLVKRVETGLSEPLAVVDELAQVWLEKPPTSVKPLMVVRGGTSAEAALWRALDTFDWVQREWEEEKHPREENGQFAHTSGSKGFSAYLQPTRKSSNRSLIKILTKGPLSSLSQATAHEARRRILEIDKQYQSKEVLLSQHLEKLDHKLAEIEKADEQHKSNPAARPLRNGSEYRGLRNAVDDVYEQIASLQDSLRREVWSQLAVTNPTKFNAKSKDEIPLHKIDNINIGIEILEQLVDRRIVEDTTLWFRNTNEDFPYYQHDTIHLGNYIAPPLIAHEIGHHIETKSPEVLQNLLNYRASRLADAKRSGRIPRDAKAEQLPGFPPNVKGYPGLFFDNYFSRRYPRNEGTELLSMGIQYFIDEPLRVCLHLVL